MSSEIEAIEENIAVQKCRQTEKKKKIANKKEGVSFKHRKIFGEVVNEIIFENLLV